MRKYNRFNATLFYASFYLQTAFLKILWVLNTNWRLKGFKGLSEAETTFSDEISKDVIRHFTGRQFQMVETDRRLLQQCQWGY